MTWECVDCGLPDSYGGEGDGVGSCDCPRCEVCSMAPGLCQGHDEGWRYEDYEELEVWERPRPQRWRRPKRPEIVVDTRGLT